MAYEVRSGAIVKRIDIDGQGIARAIQTQPSEGAVMGRIKEIRDNGLARKLEWGVALVGIPEIKLLELYRRFPDLNSPDGRVQRAAWIKFANSAEGAVYRLKDRRGQGRVKR